jgi:hypothetical protein
VGQEARDNKNRAAHHSVPARAPSVGDAALGHGAGVLTVVASVPDIAAFGVYAGRPVVKLAVLNGANETIRNEFRGRPLSELHIPRQVLVRVQGDRPNFTLNVNEAGDVGYVEHAQGAWLRARAIVGHPNNAQLDGFSQEKRGVQMLLADLVADEIKEQAF